MANHVLVVTPQTQFGTLIRKGLKEKDFEVHATADFAEAIQQLKKSNYPVVILDAEMEDIDISVIDVGYALQQIKPDLQFILVTRSGQRPETGDLVIRTTLTKPVSMSDLQRAIIQAVAQPVAASKPVDTSKFLAETSQLLWLKDVSKAAQHLTRLTLESSAQAALITHQNELWAYAGQLSRDAAQELGHSIQKYWDNEAQTDLLRFVRLQSTEAQHMLYATRLSKMMVLALVFDAETPFSTIRGQANKLARSLAETPPEIIEQFQAEPEPSVPMEEEDLPPLAELLGEVPPPNPVKVNKGNTTSPFSAPSTAPMFPVGGRAQETRPSLEPDFSQVATTHPMFSDTPISRESSPATPLSAYKRQTPAALDDNVVNKRSQLGANLSEAAQGVPPDLQVTRKQVVQPKPGQTEVEIDPQSLIETRAGISALTESVTEVAHRIVLEPVTPALYNLNYACLMLPRFENHHLIGDLADRVSDWIPQICVAFGWRLEHLSIRPDYVQWVVSVPPNTAPGYLMRVCRNQLSERIFNEFPRIKKENPSGDFWAPGYLIMGGSAPHPQKLVRDFIKRTRSMQGLNRAQE